MKTLLKLCGIGFLMGVFIGNLITVFTSLPDGGGLFTKRLLDLSGSEAMAALIQTISTGLLGAVSMGGVCFHEIENKHFGLLASAVSHLSLILVFYFPIAFLLGWIASLPEAMIMLAIMVASYFIIWFIMFLRYRAAVKELNRIKESSPDNSGNEQD